MKRVFTLFFALLVVLTLAVGASAAQAPFQDAGEIQNQAAVTMLTDLNILSGYQDGTFRPGNSISRAEIAKIMTVISTAAMPSSNAVRFADTADSWASSYISYCAQKGIITGDPSGNFRPGDSVTARELAKMLLVVVGHKPVQFTGQNWAKAVDDAAGKEGIYAGYSKDKDLYLSRDNASLLINNALQCNAIVGHDSNGAPQYALDKMMSPKSVLENRFGVVLVTGVVEANAVQDMRPSATRLEGDLIHISGYTKDFAVTRQVAYDMTLLGRKITLYAILGNDVNRVVGIPATRSQEVYTTFKNVAELNTLLQYTPVSYGERTKYFVNYAASDAACMELLGSNATVTIIDHEGDGTIEFVMVTLEKTEDKDDE